MFYRFLPIPVEILLYAPLKCHPTTVSHIKIKWFYHRAWAVYHIECRGWWDGPAVFDIGWNSITHTSHVSLKSSYSFITRGKCCFMFYKVRSEGWWYWIGLMRFNNYWKIIPMDSLNALCLSYFAYHMQYGINDVIENINVRLDSDIIVLLIFESHFRIILSFWECTACHQATIENFQK